MIFTILSLILFLIINLTHTHLLADKKYPIHTVILVLVGFAFILFLPVFWVGLVEGSSIRSIILGMLFIFPLYFLYNMSFKKMFIIMIYCWTYTLGTNTISFGIASLFASESTLTMFTFITQLGLITVTFPLIIMFVLSKFKTILKNLNNQTLNTILLLAFFIFLAFILMRFYLDVSDIAYVVLAVTISGIAFTSYHLFFSITETSIRLKSANRLANIDVLTGIYNRYALLNEMEAKIENTESFSILFMDLNELKSVNDRYSHEVGDKYLVKFAKSLKESMGETCKVYRFAGDEFICLFPNTNNDIDIKALKQKIHDLMSEEFDFIGVSIGRANYPQNGRTAEEIINLADKQMYIDKNSTE